MKTVTLPVKGLNFAGCAREIEKHLGKFAPIAQVEASYVSQTVTITYDETRLDETQLREMVKDCGFACGAPLTRFPGPIATVSRPTEAIAAQPVMAHPAMPLFHNLQKRLVPIGLWYPPQWNIVRLPRLPRRWIWVS